jgi:type II secretory pathway pseudopilin PulG
VTGFHRRQQSDRGETLLELLIAVVILGLAGVAITGGLTASGKVSDVSRKEASASALLRDYAESVESAVANSNGYLAGTGLYAAYSVPAQYPGYSATNTAKQCWSDTAWVSCQTVDHGIQQLTLSANSSDQRAVETLVVVVRRPCTAADASANHCP